MNVQPLRPLICFSVLALAASSLMACASGSGDGPSPLPPQVRAVAYAGSDWNASDIAVHVAPAGDGWTVTAESTAAKPAHSVLIELNFDHSLAAADAHSYTPAGKLSLLATNAPGVVGIGVIMPAGGSIQPGKLLSFTLRPATPRAASATPPPSFNIVTDLAATRAAGSLTLTWTYKLDGDYDQNGEINIGDLSPMAPRLGTTATTDADKVVDGDHNGVISISDLTPIGANFHAKVLGYNAYSADGADLSTANTTQIGTLAFSATTIPGGGGFRTAALTVTDAGALASSYFFVKPQVGASLEGPPSNVVNSVDPATLLFSVPPAGNSTVDAALSSAPSLALLTGDGTTTEDGAPIVAYTSSGALKLAYYRQNAWQTVNLGNYTNPKIISTASQRAVICYDASTTSIIRLSFDSAWTQTGSDTVLGISGAPTQFATDVDPVSGAIGIAVGTANGTGNCNVDFVTNASGSWVGQSVVLAASGQLGGLAFRYDANGGDPWLLFTNGTITTTGSYTLAFTLSQARLHAGTWTVTPVPYPDSPIAVDLTFDASGNPLLAITAARTTTIPLVSITASLQFDGEGASWDGSAWTFSPYFTSTLSFDLSGLPTNVGLQLNMDALGVSWARANEVCYPVTAGTVMVNTTTFVPSGGSLANTAHYAVNSGGSFADTGYFDGQPGAGFSWGEQGAVHGTAYILLTGVDPTTLLSGNLSIANSLLFWRK